MDDEKIDRRRIQAETRSTIFTRYSSLTEMAGAVLDESSRTRYPNLAPAALLLEPAQLNDDGSKLRIAVEDAVQKNGILVKNVPREFIEKTPILSLVNVYFRQPDELRQRDLPTRDVLRCALIARGVTPRVALVVQAKPR